MFGKKMLGKKFWKKILGTKFWKKILGTKFWKNKLQKKKIFITKIYSNIDKCHTIFALRLFAPSTEQGERQGVMKTSVAYDSKYAMSRARIGRK